MNTPFDGNLPTAHESATQPKRLVVVSAGTSDPSTTTMLANRVAEQAATIAARQHIELVVNFVDLRALASDVMTALVSQHMSPELQAASDLMRDADAIVASTPVYKAGASGLFTAFFQVLDNDLLIGTPVALAATGGSPRHALVVDDQLRGVFSYLRTVTVPTSLYASPDDWNDRGLSGRIERVAAELIALVAADFRGTVRGDAWGAYQHSYGSAGGNEVGIDLDSDLMRLATGGSR